MKLFAISKYEQRLEQSAEDLSQQSRCAPALIDQQILLQGVLRLNNVDL
jgi:hypothetical protein